jgi:hypothetical protein
MPFGMWKHKRAKTRRLRENAAHLGSLLTQPVVIAAYCALGHRDASAAKLLDGFDADFWY